MISNRRATSSLAAANRFVGDKVVLEEQEAEEEIAIGVV